MWWLLASLVARPVAQKWDGTSIYDVTDLGRPPGNGVRPDVTNAEQNFHTDNSYNHVPPHYVGLMCLRTAMEGGVSGIVSFATAHEEMRKRHPDLLPRLYQPFYFDRQREHAPDDVMTTHHPMLEDKDGRLIARLSHFQVKNGQKLAGVPLDAQGAAALQAFEAILNEPGMSARFQFQPGQMQLIDNRALGHKRTAFRDWPEPERKRLLVRLWLRDSGSRAYNGDRSGQIRARRSYALIEITRGQRASTGPAIEGNGFPGLISPRNHAQHMGIAGVAAVSLVGTFDVIEVRRVVGHDHIDDAELAASSRRDGSGTTR